MNTLAVVAGGNSSMICKITSTGSSKALKSILVGRQGVEPFESRIAIPGTGK